MKVLVINGPNLNLLGSREPEHYGSLTLPEIEQRCQELGAELGLSVQCMQSNHEGELIEAVQGLAKGYGGAVLNAAGYTHTSVALRDAVLACPVPVLEVHLSQPLARDEFRRVSLLAGACAGCISGLGWRSYALALHWFAMQKNASA